MGMFDNVSKVVCSKPVALAVGAGIGVLGMYTLSKIDENRKLKKTMLELEEAANALKIQQEAMKKAQQES